MRIEWGPIISERRWDVMEWMAKKQPSQQLCDTVAELAKGFEGQDKRELKRVLYLLKQAGFEPIDYDALEPATEEKRPANLLYSRTSECEYHGFSAYAYAVKNGKWIEGIVMMGHDRWRFAKGASFRSHYTEVEDAHEIPGRGIPEAVWHDCPHDYCLARIAKFVRNKELGEIPRVHGYWKQRLPEVKDMPHPSVRYPAAKLTSAQRRQYIESHPSIKTWRAGFGTDEPFWEEIHPLRWAYPDDPAGLAEVLSELFLDRREEFFGPLLVLDHSQRLRDLALRETLHGGEPARTMAIALDLETRGARSEYAEEILRWTAAEIEGELSDDEHDVCISRAAERLAA